MAQSVNPYEPAARAAQSLEPGRRAWQGARIAELAPNGPAEREGLEVGMLVTHVNGVELRDMIDWDWEADGPAVTLEGVAYQGTPQEFEFVCEVERDWGEDWGLAFDGAVFDGMRLCRNDCLFCFMKMLPPNMRKTLYMRDDDYRLSFLQGNFVTLTNLKPTDVERIVDRALSPLNVSLHAVTPEVRTRLMGKHAHRGIEALEALLEGGIEVHAQIVLVPGHNDGAELERTLAYVEERPGITSLGIVPLGYTRFQDTFAESFNDPEAARAVIEAVHPYQERSRARDGLTRFHLADEFYLSARLDPPEAVTYDGYPQYYDGIGMVRSFLDEADEALADPRNASALIEAARRFEEQGVELLFVTGTAAKPIVEGFVGRTPLACRAAVQGVRNEFFGGNVDVAGLLTARDVLEQLPQRLDGTVVVLPDVMLNVDRLTLDGASEQELRSAVAEREGRTLFVEAGPQALISCMVGL